MYEKQNRFCDNLHKLPCTLVIKMQTETSLSTLEAEIISLDHICCELFPIVDIAKDLSVAVEYFH